MMKSTAKMITCGVFPNDSTTCARVGVSWQTGRSKSKPARSGMPSTASTMNATYAHRLRSSASAKSASITRAASIRISER